MTQRSTPARKRIALVAHDGRKPELIRWAVAHKAELAVHELFATGTTGLRLQEALGLPVQRFFSGPIGGDQQIGAAIAEGRLDVLIFFWDPLWAQPHDPDVKALLRLGVLWNIPVATNETTADHLFDSPLMKSSYERTVPDVA